MTQRNENRNANEVRFYAKWTSGEVTPYLYAFEGEVKPLEEEWRSKSDVDPNFFFQEVTDLHEELVREALTAIEEMGYDVDWEEYEASDDLSILSDYAELCDDEF